MEGGRVVGVMEVLALLPANIPGSLFQDGLFGFHMVRFLEPIAVHVLALELP